jgi:serine phosphatase RsbU (regulator of sigma subunit)
VLLAAGALLAAALLIQTIVNYRYVANNLLIQEAQRVAQERVRNVERSARRSSPQDAAAFRAILEDVRADTAEQVAGLALVQSNGTIVASSGQRAAVTVSNQGRGSGPGPVMRRDVRDGRNVLVGSFLCRCGGPPPRPDDPPSQAPSLGPLRLRVALYEDSLSAPFSRLRRNAILSASAALSLLIALALIAARSKAYLRGKRLETQMELARQVQRDLLPSVDFRLPGIDVAAECRPASQVGGDFYDIVSLPDGRVSFVVGDVSGKGISAALLMGLIYGAMSNPPWGSTEDPDRAATRLNELLLTKTSGQRFATLFWCSYDPASHALRYLNAGHLPALWLRRAPDGARRIDRLAEGGPVLGLLAEESYRTASVSASAGDVIVLFSDGLTEAPNSRDEQFGEERLIAVVQQSADLPARAISDAILSAVRAFTGARPTPDDQTLLVVRLWEPQG